MVKFTLHKTTSGQSCSGSWENPTALQVYSKIKSWEEDRVGFHRRITSRTVWSQVKFRNQREMEETNLKSLVTVTFHLNIEKTAWKKH